MRDLEKKVIQLEEKNKYDAIAHDKINDKLIRLDTKIDQFNQTLSNSAVSYGAIFKDEFRQFKIEIEKILKNYVTRDEFDPVRKTVYGAIKIVLVAVLFAILGFIGLNIGN